MRRWLPALVAALVVALTSALYLSTLLPGFDLGDTASFQTMAGSAYLTPRDAYPLYYVVGDICLWLTGAEPARAMNLASALVAALACGLLVILAAELSGSIAAGAASALLFAGSYTFWSQAIIAEVYALHIVLVVLVLLTLLRWQREPTDGRLAVIFGACALAFGNHLSTVLLLPGVILFLMLAGPGGWRTLFAPRVIVMAAAIAVVGATPYLWNFAGLWHAVRPPADLREAVGAFWFDVTKADWRESMVLNVPWVMLNERLRMYTFDVRQQFTWAGPAMALVGLAVLWSVNRPRAILAAVIFATTWMFAVSYNVGDAHVFFLPSHLVVALLAGPALASLNTSFRGVAVPIVLVLIAVRMYAEYPALDRSEDGRPDELLSSLAEGVDDRRAVLLTELNWQIQNGMYYFSKETRPDLAYARLAEVAPQIDALLTDNVAIGREVIVTERAARTLSGGEDGPFRLAALDGSDLSLLEKIRMLPAGTRYALVLLRPLREYSIEPGMMLQIAGALTSSAIQSWPGDDYVAMAGVTGRPPDLIRGESAPWAARITIDGLPVDIRLDAWLAFDTIRRMGFGSVIAGRRRALIVERGLSFVALDGDGAARRTSYAAGIYEPIARFRLEPVR